MINLNFPSFIFPLHLGNPLLEERGIRCKSCCGNTTTVLFFVGFFSNSSNDTTKLYHLPKKQTISIFLSFTGNPARICWIISLPVALTNGPTWAKTGICRKCLKWCPQSGWASRGNEWNFYTPLFMKLCLALEHLCKNVFLGGLCLSPVKVMLNPL